jgi:hypothetical protein
VAVGVAVSVGVRVGSDVDVGAVVEVEVADAVGVALGVEAPSSPPLQATSTRDSASTLKKKPDRWFRRNVLRSIN